MPPRYLIQTAPRADRRVAIALDGGDRGQRATFDNEVAGGPNDSVVVIGVVRSYNHFGSHRIYTEERHRVSPMQTCNVRPLTDRRRERGIAQRH